MTQGTSPTLLIRMRHHGDDDAHESDDINTMSPSPLLQMSPNTVAVTSTPAQSHNLHNNQSIGTINVRPLAQESGALPPVPTLTSNGYVTHDAIIGKVYLINCFQYVPSSCTFDIFEMLSMNRQ